LCGRSHQRSNSPTCPTNAIKTPDCRSAFLKRR